MTLFIACVNVFLFLVRQLFTFTYRPPRIPLPSLLQTGKVCGVCLL